MKQLLTLTSSTALALSLVACEQRSSSSDSSAVQAPQEETTSASTQASTIEQLKSWIKEDASAREAAPSFLTAPLSKEDAQQALSLLFDAKKEAVKKERADEFKAKKIVLGDKVMPYKFKVYGDEPEGGHSLYISMHGGGGAPAHVNDGQWKNQVRLYKPKEGVYLAPRAATNTWDLWHQGHIDPMFDQIIEDFVAFRGVNPDKVYVMGYSAGGDGTYQLAPRMADRWAGAAMMAGHPGDAVAHNLLNLPYFLQVGEHDRPYDRNKHLVTWGEKLDKLEKENPGFYPHKWELHKGLGHWMNLKCAQAVPWMAKHTRKTWPKTLNWYQDNVTHTRFAWLANDKPAHKDFIRAEVKGQTIVLDSENVKEVTLRLSDQLVDLDQEITVTNKAGKELFKGKVERNIAALQTSLDQRLDAHSAASALLKVTLN